MKPETFHRLEGRYWRVRITWEGMAVRKCGGVCGLCVPSKFKVKPDSILIWSFENIYPPVHS